MPASNTYSKVNPGSAVSNREDLERGAWLIAPSNSPVYSSTTKERCDNVMPEWTLDVLADVDTSAVAEGQDSTTFNDEFEGQVRVFNYVQTTKRDAMVTDDQELSDSASGVTYAGAMMKAMKELNRNTEAIVLGQQARSISGATRVTAGLAEQLSGASSIFPAGYECPTAQVISGTDPTEANVDGVLRSIHDESGAYQTMRVYAGSTWTDKFAQNTMRLQSTNDNRTTINLDGSKGVIKNKVRIYEGQHGSFELFDLNSDTLYDTTNKDMAYFLDPSYVSIKEFGGLVQKELPDLGGGRRFTLRRKFAPCVKNPKGCAYWDAIA